MLCGNYAQAESKLMTALNESRKMNLVEQEKDVYNLLHDLHKKKGNPQLSLFYYEKYHRISDSTLRQINSKSIKDLLEKADRIAHEKEVLSLKIGIEHARLTHRIMVISAMLIILTPAFLVTI